VRLDLVDIVGDEGKVLALVDQQLDLRSGRNFGRQRQTLAVVPDGDGRDLSDVDLVANILDLPFPQGCYRTGSLSDASRHFCRVQTISYANQQHKTNGCSFASRRSWMDYCWDSPSSRYTFRRTYALCGLARDFPSGLAVRSSPELTEFYTN
jgi:hypothetical protein